MPSLRQRSETGISLRNPSKTILILSSDENLRRVWARTSRRSLEVLPGVVGTSSMPDVWVVASMGFSLSDSYQYSRLGHPDQPQKCKLFSNPICPLLAEDQHPYVDSPAEEYDHQFCHYGVAKEPFVFVSLRLESGLPHSAATVPVLSPVLAMAR